MSKYGPNTYPDPCWFHPRWGYSLTKHDLQRLWPNRNSTYAPWVRQACRDLLASLRCQWPKGTIHPNLRP